MTNSTPQHLPLSEPGTGALPPPEDQGSSLPEGRFPDDELSRAEQCLSMLDELKFSPRQSTIEAIFRYSRRKEEAMH